MINIFVVDTSTFLVPSAARSTTAVSAGFLKRAAFGTRHRFSGPRGDAWLADCRGDWRPDYELSFR